MWTCERCGRTVRNNDFGCDLCLSARPGADPALASKAATRDLVTEGHFQALALWHRIAAVGLAVMMTVGVLWFTVGSSSPFAHLGSRTGFGMAALWSGYVVGLAMCAFYFVVGLHLGRLQNWARITTAVLSLVSAGWTVVSLVLAEITASQLSHLDRFGSALYARHIGPGFGTYFRVLLQIAWAAAVVKTLLGAYANKIVRPDYRAVVAETHSMRPNLFRSPFFFLPAIAVGVAVFFILLALVTMSARMRVF